MGFFQGVAEEADEAEDEQHQAADELQIELVNGVVDEVDHKRHAGSRYQGVDQVACRCPDARGEAEPSALLLGSLHAEYSHGAHWRGGGYANDDAFDNER